MGSKPYISNTWCLERIDFRFPKNHINLQLLDGKAVHACGTKTICLWVFCRRVWSILLVLIDSNKNNELDKWFWQDIWWNCIRPDGKQSLNFIIWSVLKVWLLPSMFELGRFCYIFQISVKSCNRWKSSDVILPQMARDQNKLTSPTSTRSYDYALSCMSMASYAIKL